MAPQAPPLPPGFADRPFAHRGLHGPGRPENTLAAIAAAREAGHAAEIDVRLSADGHPVVFHDADLNRLTGRAGQVAQTDLATLARLPVAETAETIPTLEAALTTAGPMPLLVEAKAVAGAADRDLAVAMAARLRAHCGPVAAMSFDPALVEALAEAAPGLPRGLTTAAGAAPSAGTLRELGAVFVSHEAADLPNPAIAAMRASGWPILCWTVRSVAAERAARAHADQITFEGYSPVRPSAGQARPDRDAAAGL